MYIPYDIFLSYATLRNYLRIELKNALLCYGALISQSLQWWTDWIVILKWSRNSISLMCTALNKKRGVCVCVGGVFNLGCVLWGLFKTKKMIKKENCMLIIWKLLFSVTSELEKDIKDRLSFVGFY